MIFSFLLFLPRLLNSADMLRKKKKKITSFTPDLSEKAHMAGCQCLRQRMFSIQIDPTFYSSFFP